MVFEASFVGDLINKRSLKTRFSAGLDAATSTFAQSVLPQGVVTQGRVTQKTPLLI
jgi:hypothetical protein